MIHPLAIEDVKSQHYAEQLRQACSGQLVSQVQRVVEGDWLLALPGKQMGLQALLAACLEKAAGGMLLDSTHAQAVEAWKADSAALDNGRRSCLAVLYVDELRERAGLIASYFYGQPSQSLKVTAVTGTNGKTTACYGLARSLALLGAKSVCVGTVGIFSFEPIRQRAPYIPGQDDPLVRQLAEPGLTSLDAVSLQAWLADFLRRGIEHVCLEASSIGIVSYRLAGCSIRAAGITSFAHDHLDFHGNLQAYAEAKALLFEAPGLDHSVLAEPIEGQDPLPEVIHQAASKSAKRLAVVVQALQQPSAHQSSGRSITAASQLRLLTRLSTEGSLQIALQMADAGPGLSAAVFKDFPLPGLHNLQNAAVVAGLLHSYGFTPDRLLHALNRFVLPEGRLQRLEPFKGKTVAPERASLPRPTVWVDFAHTADALEQVLRALRPLASASKGELIVVFGCGGDRDVAKRPLMAKAAFAGADQMVVTSDNPRTENPEEIVNQILTGLEHDQRRHVLVELDRRLAIAKAIDLAGPADHVLIAGKGHETYQEVQGVRLPFDDRQVALQFLESYRPLPSLRMIYEWLRTDGLLPDGLEDSRLNPSGSQARPSDWLEPLGAISSDSRQPCRHGLFVALKGETFDGHDFVVTALQQGARAALVAHAQGMPVGISDDQSRRLIPVRDVQQALTSLAAHWRLWWAGPLAAVLGSNGKTTVKEMTNLALLEAFGQGHVHATRGNLNNHIGLPMTLLGLRPRHRVAVVEIGMNHPNEIEGLAKAAAPTAVVITNAQREHQEFMQTIEACARENGSALSFVQPKGFAALPCDLDHEPLWAKTLQARPDIQLIRFGLRGQPASTTAWGQRPLGKPNLELRAVAEPGPGLAVSLVIERPAESTSFSAVDTETLGPVRLPAIGEHYASNLAAAAGLALAMGVAPKSLQRGLARFAPVNGRGKVHQVLPNAWLVDDSYNANPDSVLAAVKALSGLEGARLIILGDMGEVGDQGPAFHEEVLHKASQAGIEEIWLLGEAMTSASRRLGIGRPFPDLASLSAALHKVLKGLPAAHPPLGFQAQKPELTAWVKGSRFMRLERLVNGVLDHYTKGLACSS